MIIVWSFKAFALTDRKICVFSNISAKKICVFSNILAKKICVFSNIFVFLHRQKA